MVRTRTFKFYTVLNWKSGDIRTYKTKPSSKRVSQYEKVIKHNVKIEAPSIDIKELSTTINVPESEVESAVSEHIPDFLKDNEGVDQ